VVTVLLCCRHDKRLKYHLTLNHKTKLTASHRHSVLMEVFKHLTKDQIILRHSILAYAG